jgi:hypothetical protein
MVKRKRQQFFGGLCYNHLLDAEQAANAIPFANAMALIKIIYGVNLPDHDAENTEAERILRELSSQTGLFSEEREGEQPRFIHLSRRIYSILYIIYRDMVLMTPDLLNSQKSGKLSAIKVSTKMRIVDFHFN